MAAEDKWLEYAQCVITEMTHLDELKNAYNKTKDAIIKKRDSATEQKKLEIKNAKIENKIGSNTASTEHKVETFRSAILSNMEKYATDKNIIDKKYDIKLSNEETELKAIKDKYALIAQREEAELKVIKDKYANLETKKTFEIQQLSTDHEKALKYYQTQIEIQERKNKVVTSDLSNNIIESTEYEELDEDAHPILSKLKFDIEIQEKKVEDYKLIRDRAGIDAEKIRAENRRAQIESNRQEEREMLRKEEERRQKAMEERQRQIDHENQQYEIRYAERRKKEEIEEVSKNKN